jgi:hypothetical protein
MAYAADTTVPVGRSREEIEEMLRRLGSDQVGCVTEAKKAVVFFRFQNLNFRFTVPLPALEDRAVKVFPSGKTRPPGQLQAVMEQLTRSRWRALNLTIKAMLVGVEAGILEFGQIFSPYIIWGDGRTTYENLLPILSQAASGQQTLPALGEISQQLCLPAGPQNK